MNIKVGAVLLTMGKRPKELERALQSLKNQSEADLDIVIEIGRAHV